MDPVNDQRSSAPRVSRYAIAFLVCLGVSTLTICLVWSHDKLLWVDELLELYSDIKPTASAVVRGQLQAPFSLEPPLFHVLLYAVHRLVPSRELASRLPSIVALLVTEGCVFWMARRAAGKDRAGVLAAVLCFAMVTLDYGPEARVYSVLTACAAVSLLCWQIAARQIGRARGRAVAGLAIATGATILCHFYGPLLMLPVLVGEAVRTARRRCVDWPVVAAIAIGGACVLLNLPFQRAVHVFQEHYYGSGVSFFNVPFTYCWIFLHFVAYHLPGRSAVPVCYTITGALAAVLIAGAVVQGTDKRQDKVPVDEWAAFATSALLPVVVFGAAQFSHAYVPRYSLPAVVGLAVLLSVIGRPWIDQWPRLADAVIVVLFGLGLMYGRWQIRAARVVRQIQMAEMEMTPELLAAQAGRADPHIYVQNLARFLSLETYGSAELREHLVGFHSRQCELLWLHRDPVSLFAQNMTETTHLPLVSFEKVHALPEPRLLVLYGDEDEEWIAAELKQEGARVMPLGRALGGRLMRVTFPPGPTCVAAGSSRQPADGEPVVLRRETLMIEGRKVERLPGAASD